MGWDPSVVVSGPPVLCGLKQLIILDKIKQKQNVSVYLILHNLM